MNKKDHTFITAVLDWYDIHGRNTLPWRNTVNPYRILVSEIMLQQTQVDRVRPKYTAFLKQFPHVQQLAAAPLSEVLIAWQGLGYNRRAKMLHQCAQMIVGEYEGVFPKTDEQLQSLPGVGQYTAGAILAFAYNQPKPIIETNIRTVYLHHWFRHQQAVSDQHILTLVAKHLSAVEPKVWYAALMDYGAHLKKVYGNPNTRSQSYTKQSPFKGSNRQARGAIIAALRKQSYTKKSLLAKLTDLNNNTVITQLCALEKEGMVVKQGSVYQLPQ